MRGAEQEYTTVSRSKGQQAKESLDTDNRTVSGYSVSAGNFKTKLRVRNGKRTDKLKRHSFLYTAL